MTDKRPLFAFSTAVVLLISLLLTGDTSAQIRTGKDMDADTFVMGVQDYLYYSPAKDSKKAGAVFSCTLGSQACTVTVSYRQGEINLAISGDGSSLDVYHGTLTIPSHNDYAMPAIGYSQASGKSLATNEYVISTHDFTGDGIPEILIAARDISGKGAHGNGLEMFVLQLKGDTWSSVGELGIFSANVSEFRIFRQAVTVKDNVKNVLYTWVYHANGFDFKASDGSTDQKSLLSIGAKSH